jgi:hypothetical protein
MVSSLYFSYCPEETEAIPYFTRYYEAKELFAWKTYYRLENSWIMNSNANVTCADPVDEKSNAVTVSFYSLILIIIFIQLYQ